MFKTKRENERLKRKVSNLEYDLSACNESLKRADASRIEAEKKYAEVKKKNDEIKDIIRDQTDADLLVNALKAVGMIKEEKKTDYRSEEQRLMALRQQAGLARKYGLLGQAQNTYAQSGLQGILGGLV